MGVAIDTILADVHNATTNALGLTVATMATGDSNQVRSFAPSASAYIEEVVVSAAAGPRIVQVRSPAMHDNVRGIQFEAAELPAQWLLPAETGQPLVSGDFLVISMDAAASSDTVAHITIYYSDALGFAARLHQWGEIAGIIKSIKPVEVDVVTNATIGQWQDTAINATEDLLHADTDYAVLGMFTSAALGGMGVKGQMTSNLRVAMPGSSSSLDLTSYYVEQNRKSGTPWIPVFNANNKQSTFVSTWAPTASVSAKVQLVLAELAQTLPQ